MHSFREDRFKEREKRATDRLISEEETKNSCIYKGLAVLRENARKPGKLETAGSRDNYSRNYVSNRLYLGVYELFTLFLFVSP
jgi:hypothetical protein